MSRLNVRADGPRRAMRRGAETERRLVAKWTLTLDEDTCGIIHERLEQTVEDLARWVTGGKDALPPATMTMLRESLEEVTEAYNDFMGAYGDAADGVRTDD